MAGISWEILAKFKFFRLAKWFNKYDIQPESLNESLRNELTRLISEEEKILSDLSQVRYEISQKLNTELRNRSWAKIDPEKLRDLRSLKSYRCTHLKGDGKVGSGSSVIKDYNVTCHTFPNAVVRIRCNGCGKKWFKGQPGWSEAVKMTEMSTNVASSSEIRLGR